MLELRLCLVVQKLVGYMMKAFYYMSIYYYDKVD